MLLFSSHKKSQKSFLELSPQKKSAVYLQLNPGKSHFPQCSVTDRLTGEQSELKSSFATKQHEQKGNRKENTFS